MLLNNSDKFIKNKVVIYSMAIAYILINVDLGTEKYILKEIKKIENVKEAHFVYGVYDIIAKVEADSIDKVKEIITMKIRRLENIKSTLTMMVMEIK